MNTEPLEVMRAIEKTPPYLRSEARKVYVGLNCEWIVRFSSIRNPYNENHPNFPYDGKKSRADELYELTMIGLYGFPVVSGRIYLDDYPELKVLPEHKKLRITGKIRAVGKLMIDLDDLKVIEVIEDKAESISIPESKKGTETVNVKGLEKILSWIRNNNALAIAGIIIGVISIPWWPAWFRLIMEL